MNLCWIRQKNNSSKSSFKRRKCGINLRLGTSQQNSINIHNFQSTSCTWSILMLLQNVLRLAGTFVAQAGLCDLSVGCSHISVCLCVWQGQIADLKRQLDIKALTGLAMLPRNILNTYYVYVCVVSCVSYVIIHIYSWFKPFQTSSSNRLQQCSRKLLSKSSGAMRCQETARPIQDESNVFFCPRAQQVKSFRTQEQLEQALGHCIPLKFSTAALAAIGCGYAGDSLVLVWMFCSQHVSACLSMT